MLKKINELWDCYSKQKNIYANYSRKLWNETVIILLLLLTTALITAGFFYICKLFWNAYILTPVGKQYSAVFTENSQVIFEILSRNSISFSIELTLQTFYVCFTICTACQFFFLPDFFIFQENFLADYVSGDYPWLWWLRSICGQDMDLQSGKWPCSFPLSRPLLCLPDVLDLQVYFFQNYLILYLIS